MEIASNGSNSKDNIFTYKPQLTKKTKKIAGSLHSDFATRQELHLRQQKKQLQQAASQLRTIQPYTGRLSPLPHTKQLPQDNNMSTTDLDESFTRDSPTKDIRTSAAQNPDESKLKHDRGDAQRVKHTRLSSTNLQRLSESPYNQGGNKAIRAPLRSNFGSTKGKRSKYSFTQVAEPDDLLGIEDQGTLQRCRTMPPGATGIKRPKMSRKLSTLGFERIQKAKLAAEKAIKNGRVFTIQGGYSMIRHALRARGWVEKFYKMDPPPKKKERKKKKPGKTVIDSDSDSDTDPDLPTSSDDDDDGKGGVPPWEEDDGIYGIMSRVVKNCPPTFIWVLRRDIIDFRYLRKEQIVNHYCKASSFTTKVGLCVNLRQLPWFEASDPDRFYPRCYRLSVEEEKDLFTDDYRQTAARCVLKWLVQRSEGTLEVRCEVIEEEDEPAAESIDEPTAAEKSAETQTEEPHVSGADHGEAVVSHCATKSQGSEAVLKDLPKPEISVKEPRKSKGSKRKPNDNVPMRVVDLALQVTEMFVVDKEHDDIDSASLVALGEDDWSLLIKGFYDLCHNGGSIRGWRSRIEEAKAVLEKVKAHCPQNSLDGLRNIWMVKPGAKSRGRGIVCKNKLEDILSLVQAQVVQKEGKYVVQKYIERPFLIYNTKFDIRQWFLVTDWNPLTIWFYKDSYLRFCSHMFTMDKFDEQIHLSNHAIQKNYKNERGRPDTLPNDNMWSCWEFSDFLKQRGHGNLFEEKIYPGMKKAIICSLLCTQDIVEYRKNSFELYGADFMLTEELELMLIEINSSPSMDRGTRVTAQFCPAVLEDCLKVVLDRRKDKNADTGRFELSFKAPQVTQPPYIGINLSVEGKTIRAPRSFAARREEHGSLRSIQEAREAAKEKEREIQESLREKEILRERQVSSTYLQQYPTLKQFVPKAAGSSSMSNSSSQRLIQPSTSVNVPRPRRRTPLGPSTSNAVDTLKSATRVSNVYGSTPRRSRSRIPATEQSPSAAEADDSSDEAAQKDISASDAERGWISGPWGRNCPRCGFGNNLHLDTSYVDCPCRRDGVYVDLGVARKRYVPLSEARVVRRSSSPGYRNPRAQRSDTRSVHRQTPSAPIAKKEPRLSPSKGNQDGYIWTPDPNVVLGKHTKVTLRYPGAENVKLSHSISQTSLHTANGLGS